MAFGNIKVVLSLDNGQFQLQLVRSGQAVKTFSKQVEEGHRSLKRIEGAVAGFGASVHRAFVSIGLARAALSNLWAVTGQWGKAIIDTNAKLERMTFLMKGLSEASGEAGKTADGINQLNQVINLAKNAPFTVDALTDSWVKFRSVGLDPSTGSMQALVDAVAAFGGTDQTLHRASVAIQQMAGKGVISMEELRQQLGEAVPSAIVLMARGMNMSMGQLVKAISSGTVEARTALGKLFAEFDRTFGGSARQLMQSYSGQVAKLKTNWILFQKEVGEGGGLFARAKELLVELNAAMDPERSRVFARALGESLRVVLDYLAKTVEWIFTYRRELLDLAKAFGALYVGIKVVLPALGLLLAALKALSVALGINVILRFASRFGIAAAAAGSFAISIKAVTTAITVMFMANPIGFIVGITSAVYLGVKAWQKYGDTVGRAAERLKEVEGVETQRDIDRANKDLTELEKILKIRKKEAAKAQFGFRPKEVVEKYKADVVEVENEIAELRAQIDKAEASRRQKVLDGEATKRQAALQESVNAYKDAFERVDREYEASLRRRNLTEEQKTKALAAFRSVLRKGELEEIEAQFRLQISLEDSLYEKARQNNDRFGMEKANENIRMMTEAMKQYRLQATAANEALDLPNVFLDMPGGGGNSQANAALDKFNSLKAKLAEVRAEIQGMDGDLAKVLQEIRDGKYDAVAQATNLSKEQLKAAIVTLTATLSEAEDKLKSMRRSQKETADAFENLGRAAGRAEEDLRLAEDALALGSLDLANARLRTFLRQMQGIRTSTQFTTEDALRDFNAQVEAAANNISKLSGIEKIMEMKEQNRQMNLELITNTRDRLNKEIELERQALQQWIAINLAKTEEGRRQAEELTKILEENIAIRKIKQESETPFRQMLDNWKDTTTRMSELTAQFTSDGIDAFVDFVRTGKLEWGSLVKQILADILKMQIRAMIANLIGSIIGGGISPGTPTTLGSNGLGGGAAPFATPFAKGGIMSSRGAMALQKYASGGIANRPQIAMFGEGDTPEAYVPLPDGRTIPVTLEGSGSKEAPNVQVNVINQSNQAVDAQQANMRFDGTTYILDVVLKNLNQPGPFRDSMRAGIR